MSFADLKYYFARLCSKKLSAVRNSAVHKKASVGNGAQIVNSRIGKYSYIHGSSLIHTDMGAFSSVASGCSIGGGRIRITDVNGMATDISAEQPTLLIEQNDVSGVISTISTALAEEGINIGVMRVGRSTRGGVASTILELDEPVSAALAAHLQALPNVRRVCVINL